MFRVHTSATSARRTILLIVAVALLLSQALGLLHRVAHAPQGVQVGHAVAVAPSVVPSAVPLTTASHVLDRLFAAHDAQGCASYDQLAHADFLWSHPPELCVTAVSTASHAVHPAWQLAAQAAGYLARGPPLQV